MNIYIYLKNRFFFYSFKDNQGVNFYWDILYSRNGIIITVSYPGEHLTICAIYIERIRLN